MVGGGVGLILGHSGHGGLVAVNIANAARAVPTLALLTLFFVHHVEGWLERRLPPRSPDG